ncbi:MAG: hypothetical protein LBL00_07800 [Endomicrobium sp.]|nr:hypothetical protein [Endomicrobium sp.]
MAKAFLKQIKNEFENNGLLKELYSDVLYSDPKRQSPQWSDDGGLIVKRKGNPKESTIEAWGVVDGQPTSKHFELLVYDDVISRENVGNIEQIQNTTEAVKLSLNLGKKGGKRRMIGTRYAMGDTYNTFIEEKIFKPRVYAATEDGKPDGKPVFLSQEELAKKRRDLGIYLFGSQMLQNPTADSSQGFDVENLRYYEQIKPDDFNLYLIIDPATAKKKDNDYSVFTLIGLGADNNYYLVYALRDRLNLKERTKKLFELKKRFPNIKDIGYEEYGMLSDIDHIKEIQEYENYRFEIKKIHGNLHKNDRIKKLVPPMETHRFFVPNNLYYVDNDDKQQDFIKQLKDELRTFPHSSHDDILDNMSRIMHVQESKESLLCWKPEFPEIARNVAPDSDEEDFSVFDKYQ